MFALLVLAAANLFWSVLPQSLEIHDPAITIWIPLGLRALAASAMAIGALLPEGFAPTSRAIRLTMTVTGTVLAVAVVATLLLAGRLANPLRGITSGTFEEASLTGSPVILAMEALLVLLFATAAVGFTAKAVRHRDPFLEWVGAAAALGAVARVNYLLFSSLYSGYVFAGDIGDIARFGFYLFLLVASVQQILALFRSLETMALLDPLTGLNNRNGLRVLGDFQLAQARRQQQSVALLYIDVDEMKGINDKFGHAAGDRALLDTAAVIGQTFRDVDVIARLGGDEFCVLLADGADAALAAERLEAILVAYRAASARPYLLHLSLGVSLKPPTWSGEVSELLEEADASMYRNKHPRRPDVQRGGKDPAKGAQQSPSSR